jgi:hypothetical protein
MQQVLGCLVSYRIAVGPQQGRKVFTFQIILAREDDDRFAQVVKVAGFRLHAGASQLKTPYSDGTSHVIFAPLDFIAKLMAQVPKPRVNLTGFHGVFAPNSATVP